MANQIPCELLECDDYDKITRSCTFNRKYIDKESVELKFTCKCDSKILKLQEKK